jgi:hypothetical protein
MKNDKLIEATKMLIWFIEYHGQCDYTLVPGKDPDWKASAHADYCKRCKVLRDFNAAMDADQADAKGE